MPQIPQFRALSKPYLQRDGMSTNYRTSSLLHRPRQDLTLRMSRLWLTRWPCCHSLIICKVAPSKISVILGLQTMGQLADTWLLASPFFFTDWEKTWFPQNSRVHSDLHSLLWSIHRLKKELPDTRQNERRIKFTRAGEGGCCQHREPTFWQSGRANLESKSLVCFYSQRGTRSWVGVLRVICWLDEGFLGGASGKEPAYQCRRRERCG